MRGILDVQSQLLALYYRPLDPIPARPEQTCGQAIAMKLDAHIQVVDLPHDGSARLALFRIIEVAGVPVGQKVLQRGRLPEVQPPGEQDLGCEPPRPYLAHVRRQVLATAARLKGQNVRVADVRDSVDASSAG